MWPHVQTWTELPKQFPVLIDVPDTLGGDVFFINSHLSCCGNDAARQDQVDEMMAWIVQNEGNLTVNTPIVYAGDLNLVGYAQQLETLLEGDIVQTQTYGQGGMPDWDGTPGPMPCQGSHINPSPTRGGTTETATSRLDDWTLCCTATL